MFRMIDDLMNYVNYFNVSNKDTTYKSVLFPEPAARLVHS